MIGKVLGDRYEILEQIGGGGMALVYKAKCRLLDRFVAIKILRDEYINDDEFIRKFRRESQAAASLSHPNIVNIYDVGVEKLEDKEIQYIVMEYIKGQTLKDYIRKKGKLDLNETIHFSIQIAEALQHAHSNHIVHRDIKPQNIMLTEDKRLKVTDFGIARAATTSTVTVTSNVLGSVHYFSPEQARGGYTDEKSDIYSLGIVMYEMITGELPYDGDSPITVALKHVQEDIAPPGHLDKTIPANMEAIIMKCVQRRQSDRYDNVSSLIKDLKSIEIHKGSEIINSNLDESPTRMVPIITNEGVDDMSNDSRNPKKPKKKGKKSDSGLKMILSGILLAFLLVSIMFVGFFQIRKIIEVDSEEIIVPKIIGMDEAKAKEEVEKLDLVFEVIGTTVNPEFKQGEIVTQIPDFDSKVKKGFPIKVTINQGDTMVKVPSLINRTLAEAESLLNADDLGINLTYKPSDTVQEGVVLEQEPEAATLVKPGTRVNLVISQGAERKSEIVPKLVGHNIKDAESMIKALGFIVGTVTPQPNDEVEKDIVVWQEYDSGNELELKTAIDLYVSSGPEEEIVDENDEETPVEGEEPKNGKKDKDKDKEGPITFVLTPFLDRDETTIKIIRHQDGSSDVVHNKKYKASEGAATINLSGKIGATFEILYDDIYQFTRTREE